MYFSLDNNFIFGALPTQLGDLSSVFYFDVNTNMLSDQIPSSIGNLTKSIFFSVESNFFTGKIPNTIGNLYQCISFSACKNQLTGVVPPSLAYMSKLTLFSLCSNQFTQGLPESFQNFRNLTNISFEVNYFSGEFPFFLLSQQFLSVIDIDNNFFKGHIPSQLGQLTTLTTIYMDINYLDGSLPNSIEQLPLLQVFSTGNNSLTGTIPESIFSSALEIFDASNNYFDSKLPNNMCRSVLLQAVLLSNNLLSGSIPSGCTPQSYKSLSNLQLYSNFLTGHLPEGLVSGNMTYLFLHHNQLSGSIPENWFDNSSSLTTLVLAINCLTGTIPESICTSNGLVQITLDGLHSSPHCERTIFPAFPQSGIILSHPVHGTIPQCLFTKPQLWDLQLSGNALTGTIPVNLSKSLRTLVLNNNLLSGTIPRSIWESNWTMLDLSFNRLRDIFPTNAFDHNKYNESISLEVNRLSGVLPSSLMTVGYANVLEGNMIDCGLMNNNLPPSDPLSSSYSCGSRTTNISLVLFALALFGLAVWISWKVLLSGIIGLVYGWVKNYHQRGIALAYLELNVTSPLIFRIAFCWAWLLYSYCRCTLDLV